MKDGILAYNIMIHKNGVVKRDKCQPQQNFLLKHVPFICVIDGSPSTRVSIYINICLYQREKCPVVTYIIPVRCLTLWRITVREHTSLQSAVLRYPPHPSPPPPGMRFEPLRYSPFIQQRYRNLSSNPGHICYYYYYYPSNKKWAGTAQLA